MDIDATSIEKKMTTIIYEPRGRAKEYAELAANLYSGCGHGCLYCYAPAATRKDRSVFHVNPSVRSNVIEKLEKDIITLDRNHDNRRILLSFTTDPYQPLDETEQLTRAAILLFHQHNLKISVLTKGGDRSLRDLDLLSKNPQLSEYGATLVFTDEEMRRIIEPFAASTESRIRCLKIAHEMGISTYVSLEPVWDPQQSLEFTTCPTADFYDFFTHLLHLPCSFQ
jgi:DNA repair photolyase